MIHYILPISKNNFVSNKFKLEFKENFIVPLGKDNILRRNPIDLRNICYHC